MKTLKLKLKILKSYEHFEFFRNFEILKFFENFEIF